jgi:hypothetical protein
MARRAQHNAARAYPLGRNFVPENGYLNDIRLNERKGISPGRGRERSCCLI